MIVRIAVKIQKHVLKDRNAWGLVTAKIDTRKAVSGLQVAKANRAVENEVRGSPDGVGVSSGVHDQLLAEPAMCEQFVGLLCQFEPAAVLAFLQSHDSYRYTVVVPYKCKAQSKSQLYVNDCFSL